MSVLHGFISVLLYAVLSCRLHAACICIYQIAFYMYKFLIIINTDFFYYSLDNLVCLNIPTGMLCNPIASSFLAKLILNEISVYWFLSCTVALQVPVKECPLYILHSAVEHQSLWIQVSDKGLRISKAGYIWTK